MKSCLFCQIDFTPRRESSKFCSKSCAARYANLNRNEVAVTGSDNAGAGFVVLPVTGGAPTEAKPEGAMIVDNVNNFIYVRVGGAWLSASLN